MARKKSCGGRRSKTKLRKEYLPFMQTLKQINPSHRTILLGHLNDETCEALYEAVKNVLENPKITPSRRAMLRKRLSPHKKVLRNLVKKSGSRSAKKKNLTKLGGNPLALILGTAIPLLLDVIFPRRR